MRLALILLVLAVPAFARETSLTPEMDKLVMEGIEDIYRMNFNAAEEASKKAMALNPEYPHPYLGAAATDFIRYSYGPDQGDDRLIEVFGKKADVAIDVSEKWLKTHPDDSQALLVLGSSYGIAARLAIVRHEYLKCWRYGSRSMKYIRAAIKADPENYDAYLGVGMFDYYTDTIPRFAGWLAKIMLGGNRERGMKEIRLTADKGHFAAVAAQLILVEIDTQDPFGARDTRDAVRLMNEIRAKYPDSSMIHSAQAVSLYENGDYAGAMKEANEYLARVRSGRYAPVNMAMARALVGTLLWAKGSKEEALAEFRAGSDAVPPVTNWSAWDQVRAAQVLDALGRRDEAVTAYKTAYAAPDRWGFKAIVKPCLSKPCVGPGYPGRFAPN